jgi:hypothetical protein
MPEKNFYCFYLPFDLGAVKDTLVTPEKLVLFLLIDSRVATYRHPDQRMQ